MPRVIAKVNFRARVHLDSKETAEARKALEDLPKDEAEITEARYNIYLGQDVYLVADLMDDGTFTNFRVVAN